MAVLNENVPRMFYYTKGSSPEKDWALTGAVCIVFWDCGNPEYVVIDDYLPTDGVRDFVFVKSKSRAELWPMMLEKAYAKKYDSYEAIEGGLVDIALAEMTNGIPMTV
jgi:calpain